jgi:hypothetical protein
MDGCSIKRPKQKYVKRLGMQPEMQEYGSMGVWEYGSMGVWEYGSMGVWMVVVSRGPSKST